MEFGECFAEVLGLPGRTRKNMPELSTFNKALHNKIEAGFQLFNLPSREMRRIRQELAAFGKATGRAVIWWDGLNGFTLVYPDPHEDIEGDGPSVDALTALRDTDKNQLNWPTLAASPLGALDHITNHELVTEGPMPAAALFVLQDTPYSPEADGPLLTHITQLHAAGAFVWQRGSETMQHPVIFLQESGGISPHVDFLLEPLRLPLLSAEEIAAQNVDFLEFSIRQGQPDAPTGLEGDDGRSLRMQLASACTGLLSHQVDDVLAEALLNNDYRFSRNCLDTIEAYRTDIINASGLITVYSGKETFADVAGLDHLKSFLRKLLSPRRDGCVARPRGILLAGVPGTGKTLTARAVAREMGYIPIELNIANLLGGIVGATEQNLRHALEIVDSSGRVVLILNEIEKALAGAGGRGDNDGGVMKRTLGTLLDWMEDHTSDVVVAATANDIDALSSAFLSRFDAVFFLDTPNEDSRKAIWELHMKRHNLPEQKLPACDEWTGREISKCCSQADLFDEPLVEAAKQIVTTAQISADDLKMKRDWAERHGALDAELGGRYKKTRSRSGSSSSNNGSGGTRGRKLGGMDPSAN